MITSLKAMAYPNDLEVFKAVISSADDFPGLYRISSSWLQALQEEIFLKWFNFLEIVHLNAKGKRWSRTEWLAAQDEIHSRAYGRNGRNDQRAEEDLKELIKERALQWYKRPRSFALALIDSQTPVERIELDKTYYMMGSLIRIQKDSVLVSYDDFKREAALTLKVDSVEALEYIDQVFSKESLGRLFLRSEVIAHLQFSTEGIEEGTLDFNFEQLDALFAEFPLSCPIFAAPNYDVTLPIRFAKPIGVTNVCRYLG